MLTKKHVLGVAACVAMALPMLASAAADQEAAMKDSNNWLHPRCLLYTSIQHFGIGDGAVLRLIDGRYFVGHRDRVADAHGPHETHPVIPRRNRKVAVSQRHAAANDFCRAARHEGNEQCPVGDALAVRRAAHEGFVSVVL